MMTTTGEKAVMRALAEWFTNVRDPAKTDNSPDALRCKEAIKEYINHGLDAHLVSYAGDGASSWCGAFAAWCWLAAGLDNEKAKKLAVSPDVKGQHPFGSTYKLLSACKADPTFRIDLKEIRLGDIVVIQHPKGKKYGDHITMAVAWDKAEENLVIVHGNGGGRNPAGEWIEGVVVSTIPKAVIVAAYRPNTRWLKTGG